MKKLIAKKLNYGDTIGVIGVSNSVSDKLIIDKAEKLFKEKGFKIKKGKYLYEDYYGSCGTRYQKAEDLNNMFKDPYVKAIICLTGGETCNTILDLIDYDLIKKNPKIFVGYSDITTLLQVINKKTGLVTFSGACFIDYGSDKGQDFFKEFEDVFIHKNISKFTDANTKIIRKGKMKGEIIGTNLACMMYQIGTDYFPSLKNKILAIESLISSPNECQRRFAILKNCNAFKSVSGILIGYNYELQKDGDIYPQMEDILLDYSKDYKFPIVKCNSFGHEIVMATIPIGVKYEINEGKITCMEKFLI